MQVEPQEMSKLPAIRPRLPDTHKGDYGRVLIIAGSEGMTGAAGLAAAAALRSGAGLVTLSVPRSIYPIVAGPLSSYITRPLPETPAGTIAHDALDVLRPLLDNFDVVGMGPGLSKNPETRRFVLNLIPALKQPLVIDADGLSLLAGNLDMLKGAKWPVTITPHPGEAATLLGTDAASVQSDRLGSALRLNQLTGATVILKGYKSVVADAAKYYVNETGNPGMATAGSGDVLLGVVAAMAGQGHESFAAAQLGAHVHGIAGDIARDRVGEISMTAADILEALPAAFKKLAGALGDKRQT